MPYHVVKSAKCPVSKPWACLKTQTGEVMGCHASEKAAQAQMAALYANEPGGMMSAPPSASRASVDNSAWDAARAWANGAASDNPAAFYNAICAGKKTGDPATQAAHALPHHYHPGDPPNAAGVRNSLSRLPQTDGLLNRAAAQAHLEAHMTAIHAGQNAAHPAQARELRAAAAAGQAGQVPLGAARSVGFPSAFEVRTVERDGQEFFHIHGTATAYGRLYDMWDKFGPYSEGVRAGAGAASLAAKPDVAFLTNHRGITMARTTNGTLELTEAATGLDYDAFANAKRQDVQILASAIRDRLVTESSFAFMIEEGEWNEDFSEYWITRYDINRGDVSAVNYGANPYTSVAARSREILADLDHLPAGAQYAAYERLAATVRPAPEPVPPVMQQPQGRSVALINTMLLAESGE